ncbi:related to dosage compensation regulatory complex/histone acetyltransferase complex, subunit MSL-3/MRG15/EAF3, and related CHROMO domain-containing proteins [Ramularia collo-cygni]|uniref:Chromatin modification-related protein EAF3 n=1 Tax=Ramularia collo-cygni TaxID=112498 RepID=A0A2D3UY58_9PEZI|nr:related to dosage compensation regulatory complex/histone acetyltransferase complex, subunit MSL-3/MRG15/EAF3, and related CHROMO domain-containing proteins [Ramularia collo-cygni]CZT17257.1 related to dosage compensation regulatory complex/histone acetyltransferase complex, subunit MSL-3/MRG15/EAF3, and related CHROMO domain-containing proteins [Ramularia collo-cygni]
MAPSTNPQPMYIKDERVLCFHGELLYEAKVLDSKMKDPNDKKEGYVYRVHYKGWKNTWDDWVPQERVRKLTDENRDLASNLRKDLNTQQRATNARGSEDRSSAVPPPPPRGTKRSREIEGIDKEDDFVRRPAVRLFMPDSLKSILVDDWEKVTKDQKLVPMPAPISITQFLDDYNEAESIHRRPGSAEADILEEVIAGIKEYFNKSLGRILLYRFERQQFYEIHKQVESGHGDHAGKTLCDMYGCEHLLRLFVSMPDLIAHTNMDTQAVARLREELAKLTQWLAKRIDKYFCAEYEHAGQNYQDMAKTNT